MEDEFSKTVRAAQIHESAQRHVLEADEHGRQILAARFDLVSLSALKGVFTLAHERGGVIGGRLDMTARLIQRCVVTLEPFEAEIAETAELRFVPASHHAPRGDEDEEDLTPETLEGPDEIPYENDLLDLGAALAEQLALALDPYPRAPGATLPSDAHDDSANPFAALKARLPRDE
ncbi:YceD family protein [Acidocella sp.]|uniref:YceD family protein n=1 Tax=Acidocella sp. TaxID=50710 RepID=UPI00261D6A8B|nr:YceD family protein [Acidocella sp.]